MITKETRDDVLIEYYEIVYEDKQSAEFWTWTHECESLATLTYKDRTLHVARNGEMYISIPAEDLDNPGQWVEHDINICRYTDDLERFAKTDFELNNLINLWCYEREYEIYHNNPWWEVYNDDVLPDGEVFGMFYEAIDWAVDFIRNDENWEND